MTISLKEVEVASLPTRIVNHKAAKESMFLNLFKLLIKNLPLDSPVKSRIASARQRRVLAEGGGRSERGAAEASWRASWTAMARSRRADMNAWRVAIEKGSSPWSMSRKATAAGKLWAIAEAMKRREVAGPHPRDRFDPTLSVAHATPWAWPSSYRSGQKWARDASGFSRSKAFLTPSAIDWAMETGFMEERRRTGKDESESSMAEGSMSQALCDLPSIRRRPIQSEKGAVLGGAKRGAVGMGHCSMDGLGRGHWTCPGLGARSGATMAHVMKKENTMKIAFAGTPEFAIDALDALVREGHEVVAVLTKPDQPGRRGMGLQRSAVKERAMVMGLPVMQPRSLRLDGKHPGEAAAAKSVLDALGIEAWVVAAYGLMLPGWALDLPRHGCLNLHASLLPRWRGAAPIQRAIEAGDAHSGVAIMRMEEGLDTGPVLMEGRVEIGPGQTAGGLERALAALGARLLIEVLRAKADGTAMETEQASEGAIYAAKVDKSEAQIDWTKPAAEIERRARAFDPAPGVWSSMRGEAVKVWGCSVEAARAGASPGTTLEAGPRGLVVACGDGALRIGQMQRPGGKRMEAAACLSGFRLAEGEMLGAGAPGQG